MKNIFPKLLLVVSVLLIQELSAKNWYSEYWQQFLWKSYECDRFKVQTFARFETGDHFKGFRSYFLSEQFAYKVTKDVTLEAHYTYIHGHSLTSPSWRWIQRIELEANRTFAFFGNSKIITRNRLEIRWRQNSVPQPDLRFRHRAMCVIPLNTQNALKSFSFFNELFYDLTRHFLDQDRICPCQLTFALSDQIELDVFVMLRLIQENEVLRKSVVLGTQFNF